MFKNLYHGSIDSYIKITASNKTGHEKDIESKQVHKLFGIIGLRKYLQFPIAVVFNPSGDCENFRRYGPIVQLQGEVDTI